MRLSISNGENNVCKIDWGTVEETGQPQVRPVCGVSSFINGDMSEWVSSILYALADNPDGAVVISSEEMLGKIDDLNLILGKSDIPEDGLYIGSLDVKA